MAEEINNNFFGIKISRLQILEYSEGNYFNWHADELNDYEGYASISFIVFLSNKTDYMGGELKWLPSSDISPTEQEKGTVVFYSSNQAHNVETVKNGKRYVLAGWLYISNIF